VAVTDVAALIVRLHVPVPVQPPPLQPVKVEPAAGVAVKVTTVPLVKPVEHVAPQEIPAGALTTLPLPIPDCVTVSAKDDCTKVAVTDVAALTRHAARTRAGATAAQPVKVEPAAGVAVRVTAHRATKGSGARRRKCQRALETVPVPAPAW
jgi:hypothetical protein